MPYTTLFSDGASELRRMGRKIEKFKWGTDNPITILRLSTKQPLPLAIGAREEWLSWALGNGWDAEQLDLLREYIKEGVSQVNYQKALREPNSFRHDIYGNRVSPVSDFHRRSADFVIRFYELTREFRNFTGSEFGAPQFRLWS